MNQDNNEQVKIKAENGKAHCPVCGKTGEYEQGGQSCADSEWVWENGNLIAVPKR